MSANADNEDIKNRGLDSILDAKYIQVYQKIFERKIGYCTEI